MENDELIDLLSKAKYWEDEYVLKYDTESFWELLKTLPKEKFAKVKPLLEENLKDTRKHQKMLDSLILKIKGDASGR